jgi:DNA-binding FrmR family transcriptional regulator
MSEKENSKAQIEQNLSHTHTHSHEHTKEVSNRLARAIGHLQKVKQMVENGDDCSDVLIQLAAVKSALNNTGKVILKDHLDHCIVHAIEKGDTAMLDEFNNAIDKFVK